MLKAENLSFGYTANEIVSRVSFTLEPGCHCALIGSNGAGKTTLAELIRRPDEMIYDGKLFYEDIGRIGYVSQFAVRDKDLDVTVYDYLCEDFLALQAQIADACAQMETAEDFDELLERYQQLLDESDSLDADNYDVNIRRQLHLAELDDKADLALCKLSGGEYKLVQVIRQMLRLPGLLIMDEPDVFLDFENLNGLRDLINAYSGTLLVVTHSRYLLAHCFDRIWHLENGDLQEFEGNYLEYNYARLQKKIDMMQQNAKMQEEIDRVSVLVERLRDEAEDIADPRRGQVLKSKVSYLARLESWQIKEPFVAIREPDIRLPEVEPADADTVVLNVEDYSLTYDRTLLEAVRFAVHGGEKVALVGPNGTGKTSMLREIWKNEHPAVRFDEQVRVGFFSQLHEDTLCDENTIYDEFLEAGVPGTTAIEALLSGYGFDPDTLGRRIGNLSGGEKNLLQLAKLAVSDANLLLLDEPSSHLDTFAQLALEKAIADYKGAVLMVSHDFYTIVNCADTILYTENGTLRPMSARAFRRMIYKNHFSKDYLELELQKKDLETKIARCLQSRDCEQAQRLCDKLGVIVGQM